jgi:phage protein D
MSIGSVFVITVGGSPLPADVGSLLISAYVDDSLHRPALFVLRFRDPERIVVAKTGARMGAAVTLAAVDPGGGAPQPLLTGEVTALEVEFDPTGTFTVIRGFDALHRLHRGRRTTTYTQSTAADIARKVAAGAGLAVGTIDASAVVYDHVGQNGQTDAEFLGGLAREIGYDITVIDGKFNFRAPRAAADAPSAAGDTGDDPLVLDLGTDLLRVRCAVTSAEQVKEVQVRGWDVADKRALIGTAAAASVTAQLPGATPVALAEAFGGASHIATDTPYGSQAEVDAAAKSVAEQIAGGFAQVEAIARGNPRLRAGAAIALDNLGAPFDGKYTITTSRHRYDEAGGYTTSFCVTGRQERSLLGLTASGAPGRGAAGVVIGQVSDVKDPLDQGRVTLTFPWLSDTYVSGWARTAQAGAGKDRGALVVPEVGDEVLVSFERGDMRRPFVIGGLHNGKDVPQPGEVPVIDSASGAVNRRSVVSRRGHRIDLLDQDGKKEGVTVATGDGKLLLELDAVGTKVTVHSDGTVTVEGSQGVVVDAGTGKLELKGKEITLTATTGVTVVGGGGAVKVTAGTELALKGAMARLEGSAQAELKAGAMCTISGALVKIN